MLRTSPLAATATVAGPTVVATLPSDVTTTVTVAVRVAHDHSLPHWPQGPPPPPLPPGPHPPGPPAHGDPSHSHPVTVYGPPVQGPSPLPHGPPWWPVMVGKVAVKTPVLPAEEQDAQREQRDEDREE